MKTCIFVKKYCSQRHICLTLLSLGKVYAVGGHDGNEHLGNMEMFDPLTNKWMMKASMNTKRYTDTQLFDWFVFLLMLNFDFRIALEIFFLFLSFSIDLKIGPLFSPYMLRSRPDWYLNMHFVWCTFYYLLYAFAMLKVLGKQQKYCFEQGCMCFSGGV